VFPDLLAYPNALAPIDHELSPLLLSLLILEVLAAHGKNHLRVLW
jgi:hypothetical protein